MRKFRGENVYPVVMLSSAQMRTGFGIKQRPHFEIVEWRTFGPPAAPAIEAPAVTAPAPADPIPGKKVAKPASSELIDDGLPEAWA